MRSLWWTLIQYDWFPLGKKGNLDTERKGKECHWMMETGIGLMTSQAKEHLELPETGRGKGGSFYRAFKGSTALPTP